MTVITQSNQGKPMAEPIAFMDDAFIPARDARVSILEPTFTKSDCVYDTVSACSSGWTITSIASREAARPWS